ncbi:hypothetical protein ABZT17_10405 [Streptomyces sp. NPDC005648]|uniref:hypothetical protein n=1 Tax=Streptomyces sp. NPDC005648 TaxID=3157044 RepID=UPI0033B39629
MSRDRSRPRRRRLDRRVLIAASVTALSLTASGCVVVHGEREVLPSATRAEAAKALTAFTTAYNKADKAYDSSLDAGHVTGALGDIDEGRLKAGHKNYPSGNPGYSPLEFSDAKFTIPKKAGWPRWFVAEARGNKGGDAHWLLVFTRDDLGDPWQVAFLTLITPGSLPQLKKDKDGWAEAVPANSTELAVPPADLSRDYTNYLKNGGKTFADGPHTSNWRAQRAKAAKQPGLATQFIDEPLTSGDYAPLALRTQDGGALVFFAHRRYQKLTAAANASIPAQKADVLALVSGEIKQSLTMEFMSNEVALDPQSGGQVSVLARLEGMTSGTGS